MANEAMKVDTQTAITVLEKPNTTARKKALDRLAYEMTEWYGDDIEAFKKAVNEAKALAEKRSSAAEKKKKDGSSKVMWAYTMPRIKAHMRAKFEVYAQDKDADLLAHRALMKRQKANAKK